MSEIFRACPRCGMLPEQFNIYDAYRCPKESACSANQGWMSAADWNRRSETKDSEVRRAELAVIEAAREHHQAHLIPVVNPGLALQKSMALGEKLAALDRLSRGEK